MLVGVLQGFLGNPGVKRKVFSGCSTAPKNGGKPGKLGEPKPDENPLDNIICVKNSASQGNNIIMRSSNGSFQKRRKCTGAGRGGGGGGGGDRREKPGRKCRRKQGREMKRERGSLEIMGVSKLRLEQD
ncbi:hypothetical protein RUM44_006446 [Polyplax serrata]|uniref:Uncharacterized protein n=1 Tax=Polyplax serrata TaxID=468196 RepID=A0ABR1AJV4_POLSC